MTDEIISSRRQGIDRRHTTSSRYVDYVKHPNRRNLFTGLVMIQQTANKINAIERWSSHHPQSQSFKRFHRETVPKRHSTMALSSRSVDKPQYRPQRPPRRNCVLVHSKHHVSGMETNGTAHVDPWETYVPLTSILIHVMTAALGFGDYSRIRKEHPMVSDTRTYLVKHIKVINQLEHYSRSRTPTRHGISADDIFLLRFPRSN